MSDLLHDTYNVMPYMSYIIKGAPPTLIQQQLIETAREFCHDTQCWIYELDPIYIKESITQYEVDDIDFPVAEIDSLKKITLCSVRRDSNNKVLSNDEIDELQPGEDYNFVNLDKSQIELLWEPDDSDESLKVQLVLRPTASGHYIDDQIYKDWYSVIADGCIAKMLMIPGVTWSNPSLAQYHYVKYNDGIRQAKFYQIRGPGTNRVVKLKWGFKTI